MLQVGPQEWRWSPQCLRWLWQRTHCIAQLLRCGTRRLGHVAGVSGVFGGNRVQPQHAPSGMGHIARAVPSFLKCQQNRPCSRSAGVSLGTKVTPISTILVRGRVDANTDYPVFLAWVFLPMGTTLSAPVQSCCANGPCG